MCIYKIHKHISISMKKELSFLYAGIHIYILIYLSENSVQIHRHTNTEEFFHSIYLQIMPC